MPPLQAGERATLTGFLDAQRATLALKCDGLTDEQLRERAVPPSALSLLGLVRHMAEVERNWFRPLLAGEDMSPADITTVIYTHRHLTTAGRTPFSSDAPCYVQRSELDRARRESADLAGWFDFAGARFELLDGDTEILRRAVRHRHPRAQRGQESGSSLR